MAEQFCLRWNNFQTNIVSALDSLKSSEDLVDVTLTCEGKNIKAHKVVLSACSPYFRSVFKDNPCQHPIIILKDVLAEDILNLLSYMYQGEVFIEENKLSSFLHTAALLQIKGLCGEPNQESNIFLQNPLNHALRHSRCNQITISPKFPSKEVPGSTVKRRRNSATDRFSDSTFGDHNKKYKAIPADDFLPLNTFGEESGDISSENLKTLTNRKVTDDVKADVMPNAVAIKHELNEEDNALAIRDPSEQELSHEGEQTELLLPHPQYENSMLARSLLSGAQSLKTDTCVNTPSKPLHMVDVNTAQTPRDALSSNIPTLKKIVLFKNSTTSSEDQIKAEQLSPRLEALDYEPEVVLSENEPIHITVNTNTAHGAGIQSLPGQGSPSASTSQGGIQMQSNHAAICGDCPHCGTKYSNQSALKYHVRLMHSDLMNRLCCYLCPRSFTMREMFKEHMWNSHGQRN